MARNYLKRKSEAYQALACINQHFEAISRHVHDLGQMGFFRLRKMNVLGGFVRELQSQIAHDVVDTMHSIEDKDMLEFEKARREWENYLDPDKAAAKPHQPAPGPTTAKSNGLAEKGSNEG